MVALQTALLVHNTDTRPIVQTSAAGAGDNKSPSAAAAGNKRLRTASASSGGHDSDEEIASDEADGKMGDKDDDQRTLSRDTERSLYKKVKLVDYPQFLAQRHKDFSNFRC